MKNQLKKLTIVLFIILTSCNNEETSKDSTDPLIGNWEYSTMYKNDKQITTQDCKPSTTEFSTNGNKTDIYYNRNNSGDCVIIDTVIMTWVRIDENSYQYTQNGFNYTFAVKFENENETLILEDSYTDGNGNLIVYKFVYNRID